MSFKPHVLPAAIAKLRWTADRRDESITLTPNQAASVLERIEKLENTVAWYQDRDFYSNGPPEEWRVNV